MTEFGDGGVLVAPDHFSPVLSARTTAATATVRTGFITSIVIIVLINRKIVRRSSIVS